VTEKDRKWLDDIRDPEGRPHCARECPIRRGEAAKLRWEWVDQGTGQPIGRSAQRVRRRRARGVPTPHCLLLMEQETKEEGLIRRAFSSLFDPNRKLGAVVARTC
jgi:integrase